MIRTSTFLAAFREPGELIHVRALPPRGVIETTENRPLKFAGTLDQLAENAGQLKQANNTRGLYFVVNPGGDKDAEIKRFVACFVENDSVSLTEQYQRLATNPLLASILVETRKSVHAYWLIDGPCSETQWRDVQARLIDYFDGDKSIKNPSRLMRLPNFNHLFKNGAGLERKSVVVHTFEPERRYTVEQMQEAFYPPSMDSDRRSPSPVFDSTSFEYHEDRHNELGERIMSRGRRNSKGNWDASCLAHNGKGKSGLVFFPDSGAVKCNNDPECDYFSLLRAEGLSDDHLPSRDQKNVSINHYESSQPKKLTVYHVKSQWSVANGIIPWPELNADAYYGLAGKIVNALEPETESDPVAILLQLLVWFGNCVGRSPYFSVERDRHYLNLFAVIVGTTGRGRKGTSTGQVVSIYDAVDNAWSSQRIQGGLSSGEGLIWAVRDPIEEKRPIREKGRTVDYETILADHGVEDKRLLVLESEFANVLRVMVRDGNTLSPVIRQAWDSGRLSVLTKNSPAMATDAHISIMGHITINELRRSLEETETANGFANRFLWAVVRRSKLLPEGGQQINVNSFISSIQQAIVHARQAGEIQRDQDARALWFESYEALSSGAPGLVGSVTSRAEAQVVRLSVIYAMLDSADEVRVEHLRAAMALWNYCNDSAAFIFGRGTGDKTADTIANALREAAPDGLTQTQISEVLGRNKNASQMSQALATLQECALVHAKKESGTGGRDRTRYFYLPATTKKTKEPL